MKKRLFFLSALLMSGIALAATPKADEELFLDPYIHSELTMTSGNLMFDIGCQIASINTKQSLAEKAVKAIAQAGIEGRAELYQGETEKLPFKENRFDSAVCVGVGDALPATMQMMCEDQVTVSGLGAHFREVGRVLKEGGRLLISAPASYGVVFHDGKQPEEAVLSHIQAVLANIGTSKDPEVIARNLDELEEVKRATFAYEGDQLALVTDEKTLRIGQSIWRKNPEGASLSYYHSEEEYLVAIHNAGLTCEEIKRPCFFGNVKYKAYRSEKDELGEAYIHNHPFTIYYVSKQ